ncbi:MAG: hypothetical protein HEQ20_14510 [Aphanizomenon flos-aquae KM1D3_PB]|jgi:hypothetical protein|uniref:hypothetical protein n=2 Tax=Nostocales TaxID=1161 RepID=UPI0005435F6F|nr:MULTISPECIES: hypothetical protein [Nostocales]KHG42416.1 hypothetical protein OA07_05360 [Aphanizomenon flos-aquae 2012/KM1/D3]OBQ23248.1 MAG: hypothetical protein AN486_00130 [Anabaena sp. AL93]QSV71737.1 MAG: hypothetical protein HEQ20_14510 [Aphanizomenon flos-aquae KM1D3_PB]
MKQQKLLIGQFFSPFIITLMSVIIVVLGIGNTNLLHIAPAAAQIFTPSDVWQKVYQQIPDFPQENQYVSKVTGKIVATDTLASRLIRYHIYNKGRSPIYRLDWKLTLADYLDANETIYVDSYPGNDILTQNPLVGDRMVISKLTRRQRNNLVQVLVNIFSPPAQKM